MTHWEVKPLSNEPLDEPLPTLAPHPVPLTAVSLHTCYFLSSPRPYCPIRHRHSCLSIGFALDILQQFHPLPFLSVDGGRNEVSRQEGPAHTRWIHLHDL